MGSDEKTVNITDGAWRVVTWKYFPQGAFSYLEHKCIPKSYRERLRRDKKRWSHYAYLRSQIHECSICEKTPPPGIQACFWFLWYEHDNEDK